MKLTPIIESFFILYRIMHDDDSYEYFNKKMKNEKSYSKNFQKKKSSISLLANPDNQLELINKNFENIQKCNDEDIEEIFLLVCNKNKKVNLIIINYINRIFF